MVASRDRLLEGIFRNQKYYHISGLPRMISNDLRGLSILLDPSIKTFSNVIKVLQAPSFSEGNFSVLIIHTTKHALVSQL